MRMTARRILYTVLAIAMILLATAAWWTADWMGHKPISSSGGLYLPERVEIPVPQFFQNDPRWGTNSLALTPSTLGAEGCAVSSAAMALASYGVNIDPARLNEFLIQTPGGYTPQGWLYWEKAAEFDPLFAPRLLPHYEDLPSYFLIDSNLLRGNPVIARLRYDNGITHFVVICGKEGFDYLIRDPGAGGTKGVYPMRELTPRIEAIRFYRKPDATD